jgi:hypothetical protein
MIKMYCRRKLAQNGALSTIVEFMAKRFPQGGLPNYRDLWLLYRMVRERKPKTILEFGSGCSTAILAKALSDNGRGHLHSIDADPYWVKSTADCIPENLKSFCEVSYSPLQHIIYEGIPGFRHEKIPTVIPDFCYLNGPPTTKERKVAVDLLDLEDKFPPNFFLVIDGREKNVQFFRENFKRDYEFQQQKFYATSTFVLRGV